jgi:hypothetical protein
MKRRGVLRLDRCCGGALSDYSFKSPGFKGELAFDLTITLLGKSVTGRRQGGL